MNPYYFQYYPLVSPFSFLLFGLLIFLLVLVQVRLLRYAYTKLGIGQKYLFSLLLLSLLGGYVNIPVAHWSGQQVIAWQASDFFGMQHVIPLAVDAPGTLIAVNLGGAVIPTLLSLYLLVKNRLYVKGTLGIVAVASVIHLLAHPVPGLGIAVPMFVPPVATTIVALLLSREYAAPLAYICGTLGALLGADLLNLDKLGNLGASVASIGGAGTFDGIFMTGILAVLLVSMAMYRRHKMKPE